VRFTTRAVAEATGGEVVGPDVEVDGISTDSRGAVIGRLFVPVEAERDGHDFVPAALAAGAAAYVTRRAPVGGTAVVVDDTTAALQALGRAARRRIDGPVIGITGSVGKTSVKDLTASILRRRMVITASERSFNNELGVPLTLANAPDDAAAAVVEMGARGVGHIALLCGIAEPTVGVVTAVGHVHTERFGTIDEVARGKGELVEALPPGGTAVLNGDDERVAAMASRTSARVVLVGRDVVAEDVRLDDELRAAFRLRSPWGTEEVRLGVRGVHQVTNALLAGAAALVVGMDVAEVASGLAEAALSPWRMELHRTPAGVLVLNDAYNANPISMAAALRSLAALPVQRRVAVLGTMAELGDVAEVEHARIGELARSLDIRVVALAEDRYRADEVVADDDAVLAALGRLRVGDAVLLKGSRVAGLERVAARLIAVGDVERP
jgi:UDP-N-acetylmuramoyl-tripeptide--D-alanyl-D-alanine ligase